MNDKRFKFIYSQKVKRNQKLRTSFMSTVRTVYILTARIPKTFVGANI